MHESDFINEVKNSLLKDFRNLHYKKIPDQVFNPNAHFNPEKDYDAFICYKGCFTALEFKLHKNKNAFALDRVSLNQRSALLDAYEASGLAYVVVGIRYENVRKAFFIPIRNFMDFCISSERKSMPLDVMEQYRQAEWVGGGHWRIKEEWITYTKSTI